MDELIWTTEQLEKWHSKSTPEVSCESALSPRKRPLKNMRCASRTESPPPTPTHGNMLKLKYPARNTAPNRGASAALSRSSLFLKNKKPKTKPRRNSSLFKRSKITAVLWPIIVKWLGKLTEKICQFFNRIVIFVLSVITQRRPHTIFFFFTYCKQNIQILWI